MNSGDPDRCDGPKSYEFFGGAFCWQGCPRTALDARAATWLRLHELAEGRLSYEVAIRAPHLQHEVWSVLARARALLERERIENAAKG